MNSYFKNQGRAQRHPTRAPVILALGLAACSADVEVPESTTVDIPSTGGTISSADGLFHASFEPGSGGRVTIETRHDVAVSGVVSKVYEVRAPSAMPWADAVWFDTHAIDAPQTKVVVTVDGGAPAPIDTQWDARSGRLESSGVDLGRRRFAVYELGFPHGDCTLRTCNDACTYCELGQSPCTPDQGRCDLAGACRPATEAGACTAGSPPGWDTPPGAGSVFVIDSLAVAADGRGFDLDAACDASGCVDNALWRLGDLMNDALRQAILGGEQLSLIELSGLDDPHAGDDDGVVTKLYAAADADDPFFPANNFSTPPGSTNCCEFLVERSSLAGAPPQARSRAPARVDRGRLRTLAPVAWRDGPRWPSSSPRAPRMRLERVQLSGRLRADLTGIDDGVLGGAIPASALARVDNPFCRTASPRCPVTFADGTLLDLVSALLGPTPDIDLDLDGPEAVVDTDGDGRIDLCCDGALQGSTCPSIVPPIDADDPASCALDPRMADGYSVAFELTAVAASIVGTVD